MQRTEEEKSEFLAQIFSKREDFEKHILDVSSDDERLEVMEILSRRMIDVLLREELNFLYMKSFEHFKFSLIANILFKEIATEVVNFLEEEFLYIKEEALEEIQSKHRVLFLLAIVKFYFSKYKKCFTDKIADSYLLLIESMPDATLDNEMIKSVLKSDFVKRKGLLVVHNYAQLYSRIRDARKLKNEQLSKLQEKSVNLYAKIHNEKLSQDEATKMASLLKKYEYDAEVVENRELCEFDDVLKRLRDTMSEYMLGIDSFKPNS